MSPLTEIKRSGRGSTLSAPTSADTSLTRDQWEYWVNRNIPSRQTLASLDKYFRFISESEYLSQNFLNFPKLLQRELLDPNVHSMSSKSVEEYVRLYYNIPSNNRSHYVIQKDFSAPMRSAAGSASERAASAELIEQTIAFTHFQTKGDDLFDISDCHMLAVIALIHQHSADLVNVAMREWMKNSKVKELHLFVEFVEMLATSEYPPEWTASVMQWN